MEKTLCFLGGYMKSGTFLLSGIGAAEAISHEDRRG